jgi:hypothetical protein
LRNAGVNNNLAQKIEEAFSVPSLLFAYFIRY